MHTPAHTHTHGRQGVYGYPPPQGYYPQGYVGQPYPPQGYPPTQQPPQGNMHVGGAKTIKKGNV